MFVYSWLALYNDGEVLQQRNPKTGVSIGTDKIDRRRLATFVLQGQYGPVCMLHFDKGDRFFYRCRTQLSNVGEKQVGHLMIVQKPGLLESAPSNHGLCVIQPPESHLIPVTEYFGEFHPNHLWWYPIQESTEERQRIGWPAGNHGDHEQI